MGIKVLRRKEGGQILPWNPILAQDERFEEMDLEPETQAQEPEVEPQVGPAVPVDDPMLGVSSPGADPAAAGAIAASLGTSLPGRRTGPDINQEEGEGKKPTRKRRQW
jgi:hypothetical protein